MPFRACFLLLLLCCPLFTSCAGDRPAPAGPFPEPPLSAEDEPVDPGCSYFYFLWGSHAEINQYYPEALEAYEKALICDPQAANIREKIPVLLLKMEDFVRAAEWLNHAVKEEPDNLSYPLLLANIALHHENYEEAIHHYDQAVRIDPENQEVQLRRGLLYDHIEKYQEAEQIFSALLKANGQYYPAHLALARLYKQTDRPENAALSYERALALNWSKELAYELGYFYVGQELHEDALRIYTTITDNDHFDERAALNRIQTLLDLNENTQALKELRILRTFSSSPAMIDMIISKVLLRENHVAAARELLEKIARRENSSEARYMLALLAFQEDDSPTALAHLRQIPPDREEFEEAVYLQVRIHEKEGQLDQAIALLKTHLAAQAGERPLFFTLLASVLQRQGDNSAAIAALAEAVARYPNDPRLLFDYGMLLERTGRSAQAMKTMEQVLYLQPDHAEALNFIGYTWADNNTNLEQALEYIARADRLRPNNGYIIDSLGWVYYRLGDFEQAARKLQRAVSLVPGDPHIHDHLGDVYHSMNRQEEALQSYQKALELFAEEEKRSTVQKKINELNRPKP
jgi:tetratricopeptide (TPR) repeat protein